MRVVTVLVAMVVIVIVAGLVAAYVAYPHRGERMPATPWLGDAMARAAEAAPVLEEEDEQFFALDGEYDKPEHRR
jgi:hypothetical protein